MGFRTEEVVSRLIRDYQFVKKPSGWLRQGVCPNCKKKRLYTHGENPWLIKCERENKCGTELEARDLYPELWESFNKRFQPTQSNPNATADAYMREARGFDIQKISGWYEQGKFWHPGLVGKTGGTYTVRFYLDADKTIYMERFVEEVTVVDQDTGEREKRKANFKGSHRGLWWQPPGLTFDDGDEVWITEGINNAIALNLAGIKSVAILSCVNYPETMLEPLQSKNITWVLALDNDRAGKKYTLRHARRMEDDGHIVTAAQVPGEKKRDWNDLHQAGRLRDEDIDSYRYYGRRLLAKSPTEKALMIYNRKNRGRFYFEYASRLYWFSLDHDKFNKMLNTLNESNSSKPADQQLDDEALREAALRESNVLHEIANCAIRFLYYQANLITDESWYYCEVTFPHKGAVVKNTFTGAQVSGSGEFKKRLLAIAPGALFTGDGRHLDEIMKHQLHGIKTVETVDFIGYSAEHDCYVFNEFAFKNGQMFRLNDEDYFDLDGLSIKTLNRSIRLGVNMEREHYRDDWLDKIRICFGNKGLVALAFWLGSLFAEQIREMHGSYPFVEIIGEPGAGKSTLIEFLWALLGRRDYEGFDPEKSSASGRARNFAQVAGLPIVLIEGDRGDESTKSRRFDWDELKPLFNGRSIFTRGMKTAGNETYEPPFRGALVISQNAEVSASEAIIQRIIHLNFTREHHTPETKRLSDELKKIPIDQVSGFIIRALECEREILDILRSKTPQYEQYLLNREGVRTVRIAHNHAQMMALVEALTIVTPLSRDDAKSAMAEIEQLADARQLAINSNHPMVQQFWEVYDYINESHDGPTVNHSLVEGEIAINLNHFYQRAAERKQELPEIKQMRRLLKSSLTPKFSGANVTTRSALYGRCFARESVKCWIFKTQPHRRT